MVVIFYQHYEFRNSPLYTSQTAQRDGAGRRNWENRAYAGNRTPFDRRKLPTCYACGKEGHLQYNCRPRMSVWARPRIPVWARPRMPVWALPQGKWGRPPGSTLTYLVTSSLGVAVWPHGSGARLCIRSLLV